MFIISIRKEVDQSIFLGEAHKEVFIKIRLVKDEIQKRLGLLE